jgi:hypothetical protein
MKRIYKYPLERRPRGQAAAMMPKGATVLAFGEKDGDLCLWAEVDPDEQPPEERRFYLLGTGWEIPIDVKRYLGSHIGPVFVWHLYEAFA